ncbi:hypothetical protein N5B55_04945 [Ralstonia pickettii]|uniref:hypothetical protein n=1 Tax=Ralstonia pickettii TaxID=329 RepID=UPI0027147DB3|nr:hypothetical protein [Ralstonia pickettii]WKZ86301.1 hypothetical protein N5B55_04945 [Ralstonia pickettii]
MNRAALRELATAIVRMQQDMRKGGGIKPKKPRTPIPPVVRQRDRKNDFRRKPKHSKDGFGDL